MKKIFLLLSLLVISIFLVGCSENLAGEAHRSSRTNADSLINSLTEIGVYNWPKYFSFSCADLILFENESVCLQIVHKTHTKECDIFLEL